MRKIIAWGRGRVTMDVCRLCEVGSGITVYPDGIRFRHTQRALTDDLCDDCRKLLRHGNGHRPAARDVAGAASR